MKLTRLVLVCTVLLLAAVPSFAAPPCTFCLDEGVGPCVNDPNSGTRCKFTNGECITVFAFCIGFVDTTMLDEWNVASIEVTHPAEGAKVVTTPAVVARAETSETTLQE